MIDRRSFLAAGTALLVAAPLRAQSVPPIRVFKDPDCGCCGTWAARLRAAGLQVRVEETRDLATVRARLGVPDAMASCHTAEFGDYVLEGHVPPAEIRRLVAERPVCRGLAVPGMPVGSPGMETPGAVPDVYDVMLFGGCGGPEVFARYRGTERI